MGNKKPNNHFLRSIENIFSRGFHYLLLQKEGHRITDFFSDTLYKPLLSGHKQTIWGNFSQMLPQIGRKIGWVPDGIPLIFFNQTVLSEIAESCSIYRGTIEATDNDFQIAIELLNTFELSDISSRNPFFLSEGETKIVWFLTQWAKRPEYLFINNLHQSLSHRRSNQFLHFLKESDSFADNLGFRGPSVVLGIAHPETSRYENLISDIKWKLIDSAILDELSINSNQNEYTYGNK